MWNWLEGIKIWFTDKMFDMKDCRGDKGPTEIHYFFSASIQYKNEDKVLQPEKVWKCKISFLFFCLEKQTEYTQQLEEYKTAVVTTSRSQIGP